MKGSYILVIDLAESLSMEVGRLGTCRFPAGLYLYCGSAMNGLEGRIRRHLRQDKKLHWHIDYLTASARVSEVWWLVSGKRWECRWAEAIACMGGEAVAPGFGSSDCRCSTHLLRLDDAAGPADTRKRLGQNAGAEGLGVWVADEMQNSRSFSLREYLSAD